MILNFNTNFGIIESASIAHEFSIDFLYNLFRLSGAPSRLSDYSRSVRFLRNKIYDWKRVYINCGIVLSSG